MTGRKTIRETDHYVLEVGEATNAFGDKAQLYIIRNKEHGVDEIVTNFLYMAEQRLEEIEKVTYSPEELPGESPAVEESSEGILERASSPKTH